MALISLMHGSQGLPTGLLHYSSGLCGGWVVNGPDGGGRGATLQVARHAM